MPGTLDELGIGHVRDAFSDCLFPGFSTIQTRAKYFITVPRIIADYLNLSPNKRHHTSLEAYLKKQEDELANRLVGNLNASGDSAETAASNGLSLGIIGSTRTDSGGAKRRPSSIYWAGLRTLGIIREPYSLAEFCRNIDQTNSANTPPDCDVAMGHHKGDNVHVSRPKRLIADLPHSSNWPKHVHIDLEHNEAKFLIDRLSNMDMPSTSIPAQLIKSGLLCTSVSNDDANGSRQTDNKALPDVLEATTFEQLNAFLQQLLQGNDAYADCRTMANNAAQFSRAMQGAHLRFNYLIAIRHGNTQYADILDQKFREWCRYVEEMGTFNDGALEQWRSPFVSLGRQIHRQTLCFLRLWYDAVTSGAPTKVLDDLVYRQANDNKGTRSLLNGWSPNAPSDRTGKAISNGSDWVGIDTLDYRWRQARQILKDIRNGLQNCPSSADKKV